MAKHGSDETASNHETRKGGDRMGDHEKGFDETKETAEQLLARLARERQQRGS